MNKEKIRVCVRIRPLNNPNPDKKTQDIIYTEGNTIKMNLEDVSKLSVKNTVTKFFDRQKNFQFENVFNQKCQTTQLYDGIVHDIVMNSLRGINSTVFVYGQTGSGKTYTMTGNYFGNTKNHYLEQSKRLKSKSPVRSSRNLKSRTPTKHDYRSTHTPKGKEKLNRTTTNLPRERKSSVPKTEGLIMMALKKIFQEIEVSEKEGEEFVVKLSYIEIYNENVYDLLRDLADHNGKTLQINEDIKKNEFHVKNAQEECITSLKEALEVLERGEKNRHFAATNLNHNSSRSHALFRIMVKYVDKENNVYESICNFVDLAGSEKLSKYEDENNRVKSDRIKESKSINKSLFFLTQIINFKSMMKNESFVPYRNSPLTKILKSSIGGNAKTAIILCINPAFMNLEQTLGTLKFGNLASRIENVVKKNTVTGDDQDKALKNMMRDYENKLKLLESKMIKDDKSGDYLSKIRSLEEQKRLLAQKYQNLMNLSLKISKIQDVKESMGVVQITEHFASCGLIDFYKIEKFNANNNKDKQRRLPENFFIKNRTYTKDIFLEDVVKSKNKQIKELYLDNVNLKKGIEQFQKQQKELKEQNEVCMRLISVMLNTNKQDFGLFSESQRTMLEGNSMKMLENCKIQSVNERLKTINGDSPTLPYLSNDVKELDINSFVKMFGGLVGKERRVNNQDLLKDKVNYVSNRQQSREEEQQKSVFNSTVSREKKENDITHSMH